MSMSHNMCTGQSAVVWLLFATMLLSSGPAAKYWQQTSYDRTKNLYAMARHVGYLYTHTHTHTHLIQVSNECHCVVLNCA